MARFTDAPEKVQSYVNKYWEELMKPTLLKMFQSIGKISKH
jgi:hypothetical protein